MEPKWMKAVVTVGQGGYEQLVYKDVPLPTPGNGEVLVKIHAAGMNNTEIQHPPWLVLIFRHRLNQRHVR